MKSLVSSVTQADILCLRGVCLHPIYVSVLPDSAIRILAEPSNNSNSSALRQQIPKSNQCVNSGEKGRDQSGFRSLAASSISEISHYLRNLA